MCGCGEWRMDLYSGQKCNNRGIDGQGPYLSSAALHFGRRRGWRWCGIRRTEQCISMSSSTVWFELNTLNSSYKWQIYRTCKRGIIVKWGKTVLWFLCPATKKVAGYYVIPSEILSVHPSVHPSAPHHSSARNSSYNFRPILFKLHRHF